MKKIIPFLFFAFIGNVIAETTYLCLADKTQGFDADKNWYATRFEPNMKFLVKMNGSTGSFSRFGENSEDAQACLLMPITEIVTCSWDYAAEFLSLNLSTNKFIYLHGYGFIQEENSDVVTAIGVCSKL